MLSVAYSVLRTAVVAAAVVFGSSAYAGTVFCPGTAATTDREFGLTTAVDSTCLAYAPGNINGNGDAINNLVYLGATFLTVDKSDDTENKQVGLDGEISTTTGPNAGTFTLTLPAGYKNFVFALKSGSGTLDPDWAAFLLAPGTISGSWTISSQGFSHANLYAQLCTTESPCPPPNDNDNPPGTPIPGAVWLFGTVLAGGAGYGRWRKKRKAQLAA